MITYLLIGFIIMILLEVIDAKIIKDVTSDYIIQLNIMRSVHAIVWPFKLLQYIIRWIKYK